MARRRGRRIGTGLIASLVLGSALFVTILVIPEHARAATLYVGGPGPGNFTTIQSAINAASPGDTVYVFSGTYLEHVSVAKTLNLFGENRTTTVVDAGGTAGDVIHVSADWVNISALTARGAGSTPGDNGIELTGADHCRVEDTLVTANGRIGIMLWANSRNNTIARNIASGNSALGIDIYLGGSSGNIIENNTVTSNPWGGIRLAGDGRNSALNNTLRNNGNSAIYVITTHNIVAGNDIANHRLGVYMDTVAGSNNTIANNRITATSEEGIMLRITYGNAVSNNTVAGNTGIGIRLYRSNANLVVGNNVSSNRQEGVLLDGSTNNTVMGNLIAGNTGSGVYLSSSTNTSVSANALISDGIFLSGGALAHWNTHVIDSSNTVNGRPVRYWKDATGGIVPSDAGEVILANSTGTTVSGEYLVDGEVGIVLGFSRTNAIVGNNASRNSRYGIFLGYSDNNTVTENNVSANGEGIHLGASNGTQVYHNNLFANARQAFDDCRNVWNDSYPSGGNYWSDYLGTDSFSGPNQNQPGGDGMGDTPYPISGGTDADRYPLMAPFGVQPLSAPRNLQAIAGNAQVALTWQRPTSDGGSPITNYTIYRGTTQGGETPLVTIPYTDVIETYVDNGLVNGQIYHYCVTAWNLAGEGARSNEVNATPATVPGAPTGLTLVPGDGQIALSWWAPADDGGSPVLSYTIYKGTTAGGESVLITLGNVYSHTDGGLINGQPYYYLVRASNSMGQGPNSTEASATPMGVPSEPLGLVLSAGDGIVILTWVAPSSDGGSPVTNYEIYRGTAPASETLLIEVGSVLTYTDTGLTNGQMYYYQVTAKNSKGEGQRSNEAAATPRTVPGQPTGLVAAAGNGQVELTWHAPVDDGGSPITNYRIHRGTTAGNETFIAEVADVLSYTDTGLTNGQIYYYEVSAKNAAGEGLNSTEVSATPATTPSEPLSIVATAGNGQVTITWTAPASDGGSPITKYTIYKGTTSGGETLLITLGNVLTYTDTGVMNGQTYYYRVTASNGVGEGPGSIEVSAEPTSSTPSGGKTILEETWFWLVVVAVIIVLVAVAVFISRRKKGKREMREPPRREEEDAGKQETQE